MKFVSIILSFYVLFLTTLPCVDSIELVCDKDSCTISHTHNYTKGHCEDENDNDGCSPFCVCNCCNTSVLVLVVEHISVPVDIPVSSVLSFYKEITSEYFCTIWQPPKI